MFDCYESQHEADLINGMLSSGTMRGELPQQPHLALTPTFVRVVKAEGSDALISLAAAKPSTKMDSPPSPSRSTQQKSIGPGASSEYVESVWGPRNPSP